MENILNKFINDIIIGDFRIANLENQTGYNLYKNGISEKGDYFASIGNREILITDDIAYMPVTLFKNIPIHSLTTINCFDRYVQKINEDIDIIIEVHKGSISGVNYGNGWEINIGIRYAEVVFKFYHFKTSGVHYHINYVINDELTSAIDFKNFVKISSRNEYKYYIPEYDMVSIFDKKLSKVTELYIKGKTLYFYDSMWYLLLDRSYDRKEGKSDLFKNKDIDKVIIKNATNMEFCLPDTTKSIEFDLEKTVPADKYGRDNSLKGRIRSLIEHVAEYYKLLPKEYRELGEKLYKRDLEMDLYNQNILINFEYKNLTGTVITNAYQYNIFQEHYANMEKIDLEIAGIKLPLTKVDFFKSLKIKKKVGKRDKQSGYTDWFLKEFNKYPEEVK
jgi:hypothetical protein